MRFIIRPFAQGESEPGRDGVGERSTGRVAERLPDVSNQLGRPGGRRRERCEPCPRVGDALRRMCLIEKRIHERIDRQDRALKAYEGPKEEGFEGKAEQLPHLDAPPRVADVDKMRRRIEIGGRSGHRGANWVGGLTDDMRSREQHQLSAKPSPDRRG